MSMLPGQLRAAFAQARNDGDYYVESESCVHSLLDMVTFNGEIHDGCCGSGIIPKVAIARGYQATGADLYNRGYGFGTCDFLLDDTQRDNIVTNPPYNLAEKMFAHACLHARHKVAFLLRISFLAGPRRRDKLFSIHRPSEVVVLSKQPSMSPGGTDVPAKNGTADYIWLIHSKSYFGPTILTWAP